MGNMSDPLTFEFALFLKDFNLQITLEQPVLEL